MSITDELREYFGKSKGTFTDHVLTIADRIDAEHECKVRQAHADGLNEQIDYLEKFVPSNYVMLPLDADGVPIKLGDAMEVGSTRIEVIGIGNVTSDMNDCGVFCQRDDGYYEWFNARFLRHVKPDSWDGIIDDAAKLARGDNVAVMKLVERCRRLTGEAEHCRIEDFEKRIARIENLLNHKTRA